MAYFFITILTSITWLKYQSLSILTAAKGHPAVSLPLSRYSEACWVSSVATIQPLFRVHSIYTTSKRSVHFPFAMHCSSSQVGLHSMPYLHISTGYTHLQSLIS